MKAYNETIKEQKHVLNGIKNKKYTLDNQSNIFTYKEDKGRTNKVTDNVNITTKSSMYLERLNTLGIIQHCTSIRQALEANHGKTLAYCKNELSQL